MDELFDELEQKKPEHFAVRQYKKYKLAAGKTAKSILISCGARLAPFDIAELRDLMAYDEMELDLLGDRRTALFVIISDTDDTFNFVVSIMYTQLFNLLCDRADDQCGGQLKYHVRLLLDEFANIGLIPKFDKLIATIRSREISASIILQSQSQLKTIYKDAYKVGRFLGWYYNALRERNGDTDPARIVIGKDTRRSSYMFEYSLVAGLTASGADAYLLHVTTTPSVAYIARVDDFDCGIMISASHNPYYDNGIKLIDCYGEKMPEETLRLVEDYIDGKLHVFDKDWPELPFAHREHIGCTVDYVAGRNRYMGYLISLGIYSFKGVKVGLDCANGSSWNIAKSVFDALGADTYVINNKPNGTNINTNAGSTHIEGLQKFVVEKGLDVGFAFDGDADRCLCVDEKGNVITGDHILYIYGCYMKERGKLLTNTVVTTVMSNFGLYKAFDEQGIGYAKTAVGDKYVYEYMAKNGCRIGGEQSGHIIFSKYASTGDGILTSLKMMEVMLAKKKPMSELAAPLKIYPQVLENVRVTDKKAAQNDPAVQEAVSKVAEALGDTGRILVRESGTEPVVRVMVEAPDHGTCQKYVDEVVNVIGKKGYKA